MSHAFRSGAIATTISIDELIVHAWREQRSGRVTLVANEWPQWSLEIRALAEVVVGEELEVNGGARGSRPGSPTTFRPGRG